MQLYGTRGLSSECLFVFLVCLHQHFSLAISFCKAFLLFSLFLLYFSLSLPSFSLSLSLSQLLSLSSLSVVAASLFPCDSFPSLRLSIFFFHCPFTSFFDLLPHSFFLLVFVSPKFIMHSFIYLCSSLSFLSPSVQFLCLSLS